ncbi:MAG: uL15 family ribosomal protein [Candidatus Aenigmarchaeota archaeon]|nr:uL15 family ribosomal protein [Candidatus Aenigmarchaeota archaeon]
MVVRKRKKILKRRGFGSPGYGSHKKHRGGGSKGGKGNAGLHKHKVHTMIKYMPDHFGRKGLRSTIPKEVKTISLMELDQMIDELLKNKKVQKEGDAIKINLSELGYDKLLGNGRTSHKLIIEGKHFSKQAVRKLEESGGQIISED